MSKTNKLIQLADKISNKHFSKIASDNSFSNIIREYDTAPLLIDDFIEGLKISAYKGYDDGKGYPSEVLQLLLKQAELIAAALESIRPELAKLDEEIYNVPV